MGKGFITHSAKFRPENRYLSEDCPAAGPSNWRRSFSGLTRDAITISIEVVGVVVGIDRKRAIAGREAWAVT